MARMPTEVQITNRNSLATKRVTAKLQDDHGESVLEFVIRPGENAIIPVMTSMSILVTEEAATDSASSAEEKAASG